MSRIKKIILVAFAWYSLCLSAYALYEFKYNFSDHLGYYYSAPSWFWKVSIKKTDSGRKLYGCYLNDEPVFYSNVIPCEKSDVKYDKEIISPSIVYERKISLNLRNIFLFLLWPITIIAGISALILSFRWAFKRPS